MPTLSKPLKVMSDKMKCLWKPAQSGKTRTMQELIRADDGVKNHLNILICSNNRLLVAQTNARMVDDLYADSPSSVDEEGPADDAVVGGVYSWMSGTKKSNISSRDLAMRILLGEVSMVVCCSHKKRFLYLVEMLDFLERLSFSKPVNVWIDEADVSVKHWSEAFDFSRFRCVREMTLVSATFDSVFEHYDRIRVMPFPETHPECYLGLRDCDLQAFDAAGRAAEYMDAVLTAHPELVKPGMKLFIPGDIERVSHNAIAEYLTKRGCVVLVLNGETKAFLFPNGDRLDIDLTLDETNPTELSHVLAEVYAARALHKVPFAVTGQLCLGRGITFQSPSFTFDAAIVPGIKDSASAYQCVARVLGNTRTFVGPFTPVVYMTSKLLAAVQRQERIATNLAKLVHENKWVDVGAQEVGLAAGDDPAAHRERYNDDDYEAVWTREFTSVEELKAAKVTHGRMPEAGDDGFYKNANGGKGPMSRTQLNALKGGKKTTNMRLPLEKVGDSTKRTYPFYEDPADPSTLRFVVRTLTRIR